MKELKASGAYYGEFITSRADTGAAADADSTPTATATKNGTDDGSFALTVAKIDTGRYKITGTVPAYTAGDQVQISVAATVNSVAGKGVVDEFVVVTGRPGIDDIPIEDAVLTSAYDAAKSAASQASVNTIDGIVDDIQTTVDGMNNVATMIETAMEYDAGPYRFTANALEQAPSGGASAADIADAVLDEALSGHTGAGSLGKAVADVLADTNELQTDLVNGGRLDLLIDAIKAKTDNLPSDPADQSAVEAAITAAHSTTNGKIDAVDDYVDSEVASIKAVTDDLAGMLETDGAVKRFTANALELAPTGEGGSGVADWTVGEKEQIRDALGITGDKATATGGQLQTLDGVADAIKAKTDNLPADPADDSDIDSQLATITGYLDTEVAAILAAVDTEIAAIKAKTDNLPASPAAVGSAMTLTAAYDAAKNAASQASVDIIDDFLDTEIAAILADTNELQTDLTNGGRLDLLIDAIKAKTDALKSSWNDLSAAQVNAEVDTALADYDAPTKAELDSGIAGISIPTAVAIRTEMDSNSTKLTNLDAAMSSRAPAATALSTAQWTNVRAALLDFLDAAISTRLATAGYTAPANSDITAIKAKTDNLPSDPADQSLVEAAITAAHSTTNGKIDAVDDYVDTEVAAIKAKTDQLTFTDGKVDANADADVDEAALATAIGDALEASLPGAIDTELSASHGAGQWGAITSGPHSWSDILVDSFGDPLEACLVEAYSDSDYSTFVTSGKTDANGAITLYFANAGTYYFRASKAGKVSGEKSEVVS